MDDNSSVSSKSSCIKTLEGIQLRQWLRFHNQKVSNKYEKTEINDRNKKLLLAGLDTEDNPEHILRNIINVQHSNDMIVKYDVSPLLCSKVVDNVMRDRSLRGRMQSGIHPVTLLAEKRRKIILRALTNITPSPTGAVDVPIQEVITKSLSAAELHAFKDDSVKRYEASLSSSSRSKNSNPLVDYNNLRRFTPEWDNYNTMRSRWSYIKPQIAKLTSEKATIAPNTTKKYIEINKDTTINGDINDIQYFKMKHDKKRVMDERVKTKQNELELARIKAMNTYYVPNPCVRY